MTRAELELDKGGFELTIDEPLKQPVKLLALRGTMGGFAASGVGNAKPRTLQVDFTMGGMQIDLRGAWLNDSDVTVRTSMGGGLVRLPRDAIVEGVPSDKIGRNPQQGDVPLPTLRFSASSTMGELEFDR